MSSLVSVIAPVYNEESGIKLFYHNLLNIINEIDLNFEIIFVNDGSTDNSKSIICKLIEKDNRVKLISLSRNFGHQKAIISGITNSNGDAVILIDVDLEDDPKYISDFITYWQKGYHVVFAQRSGRKVNVIKKLSFTIFHKINNLISDIHIDNAGIFSLMDRRVINCIQDMPEIEKYIPGIRRWVGFKQIGIDAVRGKRYDETPRVTIDQLLKLAIGSFVGFSTIPLKISVLFGFLFAILSFIGIFAIIILKLFYNVPFQGWATIVCAIFLIGGIQLMCSGMQGEYIAMILTEVKRRPEFIIEEKIGFN